jgi:hypothetical protein
LGRSTSDAISEEGRRCLAGAPVVLQATASRSVAVAGATEGAKKLPPGEEECGLGHRRRGASAGRSASPSGTIQARDAWERRIRDFVTGLGERLFSCCSFPLKRRPPHRTFSFAEQSPNEPTLCRASDRDLWINQSASQPWEYFHIAFIKVDDS